VLISATQVAAQSPSSLRSVAMGPSQACALAEDGRVLCWYWSGVAVSTTGELLVSTYAPAGLPAIETIAVGGAHVCATTRADGSVWCWGSNSLGQLGIRGEGGATPTRVPSRLAFVSVTAGRDHTCALTAEGEAWCWGDQWEGSTGTLPTGETVRDPSPVRGSRRFVRLSAGDRHTCGVTLAGDAACWGDNSSRAIRADNWRTFFSPVDVQDIGSVRTVDSGSGISCALRADGVAICWGSAATQPPAESGRRYSQLAVASGFVCGLRPTQEVDCWGAVVSGDAPDQVRGPLRFGGEPVHAVSIVGAGARSCAITTGGDLLCWEGADMELVRPLRLPLRS
jgi:alpha-tubulin suppressor-like RCC1 family protein